MAAQGIILKNCVRYLPRYRTRLQLHWGYWPNASKLATRDPSGAAGDEQHTEWKYPGRY